MSEENTSQRCYSGRTVEPMGIAQGSDGSLVVADMFTRNVLKFSAGSFAPLTPLSGVSYLIPRALVEDRDGNIWLGTLGQGLFRIRGKHVERFTRKEGLSSDVVETLKEDEQGNLWVGTANGLDRFSDPEAPRLSTLEGLSSDLITAVYGSSSGSTWVGTAGGGLNRIHDGVITTYGKDAGLPGNTILALGEDSRGRLWVSTATGVVLSSGSRFLPVSLSRHSTLDQVFGIAGAPDGTVRLANSKIWLPPVPATATQSPFGSRTFLWIRMYRKSCVPAQEFCGSASIMDRSRRWQAPMWCVSGRATAWPGGVVQALFEAGRRNHLGGNVRRGLSRFRRGKWTTWTQALGIPEGGAHAITDDGHGGLILLGARAVFRIPPAMLDLSPDGLPQSLLISRIGSGESVVLQNRGTMAGPQVAKSMDGRVWVGTNGWA